MKKLYSYIRGNSFFQMVVNLLLSAFLLVELYPILYVISCSFSNPDAITAGKVLLWPVDVSLEGYRQIFQYTDIWIGYGNTIFYTVVGTAINLAVTLPCAYALSRNDLIGGKAIMIFFMITMYVGGGLIPTYLNMKSFGLVDNRAVLLVLGALSVYNMIVAKSFFANSIPYEVSEAATIDGCDDFAIFFRIILPLSKAIIVVMILYYGIGHWNSYFNAMIYLNDRNKYPLQMFLREILLQSKLTADVLNDSSISSEEALRLAEQAKAAELIKYCVIVVATLPMMIIYPKLQKYFEKGVMIGSVKG